MIAPVFWRHSNSVPHHILSGWISAWKLWQLLHDIYPRHPSGTGLDMEAVLLSMCHSAINSLLSQSLFFFIYCHFLTRLKAKKKKKINPKSKAKKRKRVLLLNLQNTKQSLLLQLYKVEKSSRDPKNRAPTRREAIVTRAPLKESVRGFFGCFF